MCLNDVIDQINTNNCIATFQMLYGTDECTIDKQKKRYGQAIEAFRVYFPSRLDISIFSAPGRTEITPIINAVLYWQVPLISMLLP